MNLGEYVYQANYLGAAVAVVIAVQAEKVAILNQYGLIVVVEKRLPPATKADWDREACSYIKAVSDRLVGRYVI